MINICIYEDDAYQSLLPLTFLRPAYDLLIGISPILAKIEHFFSYGNITLHARDYLTPLLKKNHPKLAVNRINSGSPCLFINGRVLMNDALFNILTEREDGHDLLFTQMGHVVALYLHGEHIATMREMLKKIPSNPEIIQYFRPKCVTRELEDIIIISDLWQLPAINKSIIKRDFQQANQPGILKGDLKPCVAIYNENNVFIDKNASIEDFVVLDATKGPIYIEENVSISAHSRLEGPLFIGKNSSILGAKIRASSIGPACKIGGEVTNCVFLRYSNKAHDGFMGHSYVGEWVNLGANTVNSNLKNNYQPIRMDFGKKQVDTKQMFMGAIIGDHVKTGIGTQFNSGTIIGYGTSLFGVGLHPKYIPPFCWGSPTQTSKHLLEKFFKTAETMMARRHVALEVDHKELIKLLYDHLAPSEDPEFVAAQKNET